MSKKINIKSIKTKSKLKTKKTHTPIPHKAKQCVILTLEDLTTIQSLLKKGTHKARTITRAKILLRSNKGEKDKYIATEESCNISTVKTIRIRYSKHGLDKALYEDKRSGQPTKIDTQAEAYLIATACSEAPDGYDRWTLELLQKKMIVDKKIKTISTVALWNRLNKQGIKPWREKNVVHP